MDGAGTWVRFLPAPKDPSWRAGWVPVHFGDRSRRLEDLTQEVFLCHNFRVRVEFTLGGEDFGDAALQTSVLDFVLMLESARRMLRADGAGVLELSDRAGEWISTCATGGSGCARARRRGTDTGISPTGRARSRRSTGSSTGPWWTLSP
jgi:hypothetical protein